MERGHEGASPSTPPRAAVRPCATARVLPIGVRGVTLTTLGTLVGLPAGAALPLVRSRFVERSRTARPGDKRTAKGILDA